MTKKIESSDKIALFDMDGTLVDYEKRLIADLKILRSPGEPIPILNWDNNPAWLEERIKLIKSQPGWWLNLPKIYSGVVMMHLVKQVGFQVHICTKGPRHTASAWSEKLLWCQQNIDENVDITITQDKGLVYGRVLIDDYPEYMIRWLKHRPRGLGLMPQESYNSGFAHPNVIKYPRNFKRGSAIYNIISNALMEAYNR